MTSKVFFFVFSVSLCRGNPVRGDRTENQTKWWWQEQKLLSGQKIKPMTINNKNRTMVCLCENNPFKFHLKIWWVGCKKTWWEKRKCGPWAWDFQCHPPLNYKVQFLPVISQPLAKLARLFPALGPGHSAMIQNFLWTKQLWAAGLI